MRGQIAAEMGDALPTVALGTGKTAIALAAAGSATCAILNDGSLKCWGNSLYGELGLGSTDDRGDDPGEMGDNLPAVNLGTGKTALQISGRQFHFCALLNDHSVKCWGYNADGALGVGDNVNRGGAPGQMGDNLPAVNLGTGKTAVKVAVGGWASCALLNDGSVKCWGANSWGQLGLGLPQTADLGDGPGEMGDNLPAVNLGTGKIAVDLVTGVYYACVILNDDGVKCWGGNGRGELGIGSAGNIGNDPSHMGDNLPAVSLF
jgi:alpha-tubulin suppressor-like RCC1 family protein